MTTVPIYPDNGPNRPANGTIQKPVLVLGAEGEVGQAVVGALLESGYPVIAVALGVLVLGEPFTSRMAIAALLVFAGVALVRLTAGSAPRTTPAPAVLSARPEARRIA